MKRIGVALILLLAFCGLADSAYLTEHALNGTPIICTIHSLSGCNTVADSHYSRVFGIPLAEIGVFFYGILFILAALELFLFDQFLRRVLQILSLGGILASLYFVFVQVFVIHALCVYCLVSAALTLFIFSCATLIEPLRKNKNERPTVIVPSPPHLPMPPRP